MMRCVLIGSFSMRLEKMKHTKLQPFYSVLIIVYEDMFYIKVESRISKVAATKLPNWDLDSLGPLVHSDTLPCRNGFGGEAWCWLQWIMLVLFPFGYLGLTHCAAVVTTVDREAHPRR